MDLRKRHSEESEIPAKSARKRSFAVEPILAVNVTSELLPLVEFNVYAIVNKRNISKILKVLPALDDAFSHLKRIQGDRILVGPNSSTMEDDKEAEILKKIREVDAEEGAIERRCVPRLKPLTKRQFEWAKQKWPTSFHADKRLESILEGTFFEKDELDRIQRLIMRVEGSEGGLVVDPSVREGDGVVAEGICDPSNPLGHPVMEAVKKLAEKHRNSEDGEQYLATGFDVFLFREPCAMCAMALVHCRASRVFFSELTPKGGAFISSWNLHHEPQINHHYEVYRLRETL
ncbi:hypothetical protein L596_024271 [Steinernema carpocapsae]|uniref:CMP/dCMP-type deaminase domain-containing protein n=1 Tax=Steinernema carpocapsae TaxID=34508 RepID=A0A4U5MG84_STECR|nr:hypothetical protein L596_024271 [Steinernema carpocapsae]